MTPCAHASACRSAVAAPVPSPSAVIAMTTRPRFRLPFGGRRAQDGLPSPIDAVDRRPPPTLRAPEPDDMRVTERRHGAVGPDGAAHRMMIPSNAGCHPRFSAAYPRPERAGRASPHFWSFIGLRFRRRAKRGSPTVRDQVGNPSQHGHRRPVPQANAPPCSWDAFGVRSRRSPIVPRSPSAHGGWARARRAATAIGFSDGRRCCQARSAIWHIFCEVGERCGRLDDNRLFSPPGERADAFADLPINDVSLTLR